MKFIVERTVNGGYLVTYKGQKFVFADLEALKNWIYSLPPIQKSTS
jgi:hypothetical protein